MIEANEGREEIEKLGRHEFILDTEEHQRLLAAEEEVLQKVRTSQHTDSTHIVSSSAKLLCPPVSACSKGVHACNCLCCRSARSWSSPILPSCT